MIKFCWWRDGQKLWCHNLYFKIALAIFADIIKIVTMFIKTITKDSRKVKRIRNYISKFNLYLYFLMQQNCWFPVNKDVKYSSGSKRTSPGTRLNIFWELFKIFPALDENLSERVIQELRVSMSWQKITKISTKYS